VAAVVNKGTVVVNRGAVGVMLDMKRAQVVSLLGKPIYENQNGFMQYSNDNIFDVYLNTATKRVRLIGVSGPNFCTAKGICMFKKTGRAKLKAQFGGGLTKYTDETGETVDRVKGSLGGKPVFTDFFFDKGRIIQIFIGYR
jgi:hypothetical protein